MTEDKVLIGMEYVYDCVRKSWFQGATTINKYSLMYIIKERRVDEGGNAHCIVTPCAYGTPEAKYYMSSKLNEKWIPANHRRTTTDNLVYFNNHPTTTKQDVLDFIQHCIDLREKELENATTGI